MTPTLILTTILLGLTPGFLLLMIIAVFVGKAWYSRDRELSETRSALVVWSSRALAAERELGEVLGRDAEDLDLDGDGDGEEWKQSGG